MTGFDVIKALLAALGTAAVVAGYVGAESALAAAAVIGAFAVYAGACGTTEALHTLREESAPADAARSRVRLRVCEPLPQPAHDLVLAPGAENVRGRR
jgi:hypothetical protein